MSAAVGQIAAGNCRAMRTDLTLCTADGTEHDVAVLAPAGTCWGAVVTALPQQLAMPAALWCGPWTVGPGAVVGTPPLVTGAVLTAHRPTGGVIASRRLEVVGGPDAGCTAPLRRERIVVGRDPSCDLVLTDARASRRHAGFEPTAAGVTVTDLGSTDGTILDGRRITAPATLGCGSVVRIGDTFLCINGFDEVPAEPGAAASGEVGVVALPGEPPLPGAPRTAVLATVLPAAAAGGLAAALGSWQFLAFAALAPVTALGTLLAERRSARRSRRHALSRYTGELREARRAVATRLRAEQLRRRAAHPGPAGVQRVASVATRWPPVDQGLRVRVGLGAPPSQLRVSQSGREHAAGTAIDVPVTVDLTAGCLGVVGPPELRAGLARWLVSQAALRNPPGTLAVALVEPAPGWRWARWLPHVGSPAPDGRVLRVAEPRRWRAEFGPPGLVLAGHVAELPSACTQLVVATDDAAVLVRTPDGAAVPAVADQVSVGWAERFARTLAAIDQAAPASGVLPAECRLLDLLGDPGPTAHSVRERWAASTGAASTVAGIDSRGTVRIDLDRDGPHALVAGSTGAGKSELLQTLVAGLAMSHPPSDLSFLLVDYKGGAAFTACARLPHTVGLVTDLDEHLTRRVLTALDAELRRRERVLADAGAPDLASYRRLPDAAPLARLVIVVDEFAALAEELGGFVAELVGIARRGRSLGVHLVLATQRPAGVVSAEIRANTALRICLRVTSPADSLDVVETGAAAELGPETPGRGYLRTGTATRVFQAARVAAPNGTAGSIAVAPLDGWRRRVDVDVAGEPTDLERIVSAAGAAAVLHPAIAAPHRPWLPALPHPLDLPATDAPATEVPVGLVDLPSLQRQEPLTVDLERGETILVTGRVRSGRSTVLHTVACSATRHLSPQQLQICAVDATGSGLASLRSLPQTGTVATCEDGFEFSARLIERVAAGLRAAQAAAPALLFLIDGWDQLVTAADEFDGGRSVERLLAVIGDAPAAGATVVVTGGRATVTSRLSALCTVRWLLALGEPGEYAAAGVPADAVPTSAASGRGVRLADRAEIQIARPPAPDRSAAACAGALRLRPLPHRVGVAQLPAGGASAVLGVCGDDAAVVRLDLREHRLRMLVSGPPRSGRSTVLCTVLAQARELPMLVAAAPRSPLSGLAAQRGVPVLAPESAPTGLPDAGLVLVDDVEAYADTWFDDALAAWLGADVAGRAAVIAGRADAMAMSYRGAVAAMRAERCGLLLQPGPGDGDLLGVTVARSRASRRPGRGLLVPDPRWGLGTDPVPIQVATP